MSIWSNQQIKNIVNVKVVFLPTSITSDKIKNPILALSSGPEPTSPIMERVIFKWKIN